MSFQISSGVLEESAPRESSPVGTYGFCSDLGVGREIRTW